MNCKPNDLAVIVRSLAGNEGKIVRCVRYIPKQRYSDGDVQESWEIDRKLPSTEPRLTNIFPDAWLRPIRPNDGEDETLTWAGKPEHVKEEA